LDEFNHTEGFKSFLVVLKVYIGLDGILAAGIFEEKRAKDSMVLFEEILDVLNITNLHQIRRIKLKLLLVLFVELRPKTILF
jgi:hypothetical protein